MRRTSAYTLSFDGGNLEVDLISKVAARQVEHPVLITGSGPDPRAYVIFRTTNDAQACLIADLLTFHPNGTPRVRNTTLTTGQGNHTRTVKSEGTTMSTKTPTTYDVILSDGTGCGSRARKDAAIKLGDMQGQPYTVVSQPSGKVVHEFTEHGTVTEVDADIETPTEDEAPAPAPAKSTKAKAPAKATAPKKEKTVAKTEKNEAPEGTELEFEGLGKYYARAAGLHGAEKIGAVYGVEASLTGTTLTLTGSDEDIESVSAHLLALWPAAKVAHMAYRKADATYSAISKDRKDKDANAERFALEVKYFNEFFNGAADEIAGSAKKKGGAYKDGVLAVRNPAPEADDADVI